MNIHSFMWLDSRVFMGEEAENKVRNKDGRRNYKMPLGLAQDFWLYVKDWGNCKSPTSYWLRNLTLANPLGDELHWDQNWGKENCLNVIIVTESLQKEHILKSYILKSSHNSGGFRI